MKARVVSPAFLLLFSPLAPFASAQEAPSITATDVEAGESAITLDLRDQLARDETARDYVADRILRSSIARRFTDAQDPGAARAEISSWIAKHSLDGAHLAMGFESDDEAGNHHFEEQLSSRIKRQFELNPTRYNGLLGILMAASGQSKLIMKQDKMSEEEQRELIKRMFEGKESAAGKVLNEPKNAGSPSTFTDAPAVTAKLPEMSFYDRLSGENPTGYSPNVVAFQSALNLRRVPGAPRLIETGKLDYQTLVFPYYLLNYDAGRLEKQLKSHESWVAQHFGEDGAPAEKEKSKAMKARLARRREFLGRAAKAVENLKSDAEKTRDPKHITRKALRELGARQKDAARWITAASLEEDLQRMEAVEDFWSDELKAQIRSAPVDEDVRRRYLSEGDRLLGRLKETKRRDSQAVAILESADYDKRRPELEKTIAAAAAARKDLPANIDLLRGVPFRLNAAWTPLSAWKEWLERWVRKLVPNSSYAKRLARRDVEISSLRDAFADISRSDYASARRRFPM